MAGRLKDTKITGFYLYLHEKISFKEPSHIDTSIIIPIPINMLPI
jgi:hypothetical protein